MKFFGLKFLFLLSVGGLLIFYFVLNFGLSNILIRSDLFATGDIKYNVTIAAVICAKPKDRNSINEAVTMIKSVFISFVVYESYSIAKVTFHLFVDKFTEKDLFMLKLKEFGYPFSNFEVEIQFHSAEESTPEKYRTMMMYEKKFRCNYVRMFIPDVLTEVDAVLYVDTDVLFSGRILDLWNLFYDMNDRQLVGIAPDTPDNYIRKKNESKSDYPFPLIKGLNTGVMLMNLTRMRTYPWTEKLLRAYKDYKKAGVDLTVQKIIDILLYYDFELLYPLSCHFNFWRVFCQTCVGAEIDPVGIQILHGVASSYSRGQAFKDLYFYYKDFNFTGSTTISQIKNELIIPIWNKYKVETNKGHHKNCNGFVDKYLFKQFRAKNRTEID